MAQYVTHEPCPQCGSRDNVASYTDGSKKCFTPGCDYTVEGGGQCENNFDYALGEYPDFLEQYKSICKDTILKYKVTRREFLNNISISYPYYYNGKICGAKERVLLINDQLSWDDKTFYTLGKATHVLFGNQTIEHNLEVLKPILITEGELDAMAAYQMLNGAFHCLSIPNGAKSAKRAIAKNLELLSDHKIYICFDNDEPGIQAADEILDALKPGMTFRVNIPQGYKDAHEMLMDGAYQAFKEAVNTAQPVLPKGINDTKELMDRALKHWKNLFDTEGTFTSGYPSLDNLMINGFRVGEVIVVAAGSGLGKSTFAFNLAYNVLALGTRTLFLPSEMSDEDVFMLFTSIKVGQRLIDMPDSERLAVDTDKITDQMLELIDKLHIHKNLNGVTTKLLCDVIEFYCRAYKVKFVVLDHMHHIRSESDNVTYHLDNLAARLKEVAISCNCTILAIAHTNREQTDKKTNKVEVARVRSSEGITQNADMVLGLERDRLTQSQTLVKPLKAHRIRGVYDPILFNFDRNTLRYTESKVTSQRAPSDETF